MWINIIIAESEVRSSGVCLLTADILQCTSLCRLSCVLRVFLSSLFTVIPFSMSQSFVQFFASRFLPYCNSRKLSSPLITEQLFPYKPFPPLYLTIYYLSISLKLHVLFTGLGYVVFRCITERCKKLMAEPLNSLNCGRADVTWYVVAPRCPR